MERFWIGSQQSLDWIFKHKPNGKAESHKVYISYLERNIKANHKGIGLAHYGNALPCMIIKKFLVECFNH